MKKLIIFLISVILFTASIARAEEVPLNIGEAITIALRDNSDILLKVEDVKKSKLDIEEARALLYPTLNVTSTWARNRGYYTKDFGYLTNQAALKQYLYKGGKTINTIKYNEYLLDVSETLLEKEQLETALNVKKAFYTLLLAEKLAKLNKAILKNTKSHLGFIEARYKNGELSGSDIIKIKSSLDSVKEEYEASLNQISSAQALLNSYLHLEKDVQIIPKEEFVYIIREIAYDEALLEALKERPEIRQYLAQGKANEYNIEVTKADNRPNIYASWDYYNRSHGAAGTNKNWNDYNVIGITFSWPIFDGFATKAKVEQAIVDLREIEILKDKVARDIALELKNAYLNLKNAIAKLNVVESNLKAYKDNLLTLKEKFNKGIASFLDVDDAVLKHLISKFNRNQAVYDYIIAKGNFDKAMGGM